MIGRMPARPGVPSLTLLAILVITAGWWALALWPAGGIEPEWLLRTRAVCFGSVPGGLPDVGGWIVLIGEPLGMLGALLAVWGHALRDDLKRLSGDRRWRPVLGAVALATAVGLVLTVRQISFIAGLGATALPVQSGSPAEVNIDATSHVLVDQHGARTTLADFGGPVVLTFAFGHCATICPVVVHDTRTARAAAQRDDVPLVVITLDPWRDTPEHLPHIASAWELGPRDRVLSGDIDVVQEALDALGVPRRRDERTGDIEHPAVVMATDARGHVVLRIDGAWGKLGELFAALPPAAMPR